MAQIFPVATRQPGILNTFASPRTVEAGAAGKHYLVLSDIPQVDLDNPSVSFDLRMYVRNADLSWPPLENPNIGITFVGGPNKGKGGGLTVPPGWSQDGNVIAGKQVAFWLNVTGVAFDMGLTATQI